MPINPLVYRMAVRAAAAKKAGRTLQAQAPGPAPAPSPAHSPSDEFLWKIVLPLWLVFIVCFQLAGLLFRLAIYPYLVILQLRAEGVPTGPFRVFFGQQREERKYAVDFSKSSDESSEEDVEKSVVCMPPDFFGLYHAEQGPVFATTLGSTICISVVDPDIIREVFEADATMLGKGTDFTKECAVFGKGLLASERGLWAHQRKHMAPTLLTPSFVERSLKCAHEWADLFLGKLSVPEDPDFAREVDICPLFANIAFQVMMRGSFGPATKTAPDLVAKLFASCENYREAVASTTLNKHSFFQRFYSSSAKGTIKREAAAIRDAIFGLVVERRKASIANKELAKEDRVMDDFDESEVDDYFSALIRGGVETQMSTRQMADEVTTVIFAGYDKMSQLLTWATMLLAVNPEWQDLVREEAFAVCGPEGEVTRELLPRLEVVESVIFETLRLFPALPTLVRQCQKEVKAKNFTVQKDCRISVPVAHMQRSEALWGPDPEQFQPKRFAPRMCPAKPELASSSSNGEGISKEEPTQDGVRPETVDPGDVSGREGCGQAASPYEAGCGPQDFVTFGVGQRSCPGRALALAEAKAVIVALLTRYDVELAPGYRHEPVATAATALRPRYGMPILFRRLPESS